MDRETAPVGGKALSTAAVVAAVYASLQLLSNIASLKVGIVFGLAVDMGTFCYPLSFTVRDMAHKLIGKRGVARLILASAAICLFASVYLALSTTAPAAGADNGFSSVFAPMWRIVAASILAMVVSEFVDTGIYELVAKSRFDRLWLRSAASNIVSIPLDSAIFAFTAFAFSLPVHDVFEIFIFNTIVKLAVGVVSVPAVYMTRTVKDPGAR